VSSTAVGSKQFSNIAATTAAFPLRGGRYSLVVTAMFGGGKCVMK
jgi:hypothetical protein